MTSKFKLNHSLIHPYLGGCRVKVKIDPNLIYDLKFSASNNLSSYKKLSSVFGVLSRKEFNLFNYKQFNHLGENMICIR